MTRRSWIAAALVLLGLWLLFAVTVAATGVLVDMIGLAALLGAALMEGGGA